MYFVNSLYRLFCSIISLFLISVSVANGQFALSGQVVDAETLDPIPYVNIGIAALASGTVSDHEGVFQIAAPDEDQVIRFSAIGYESLSLTWTHVEQEGSITLERNTYYLEPEEISAARLSNESIILGMYNKGHGQSFSFGSSQVGTEIGAPINIRSKTYIESVHFKVNHAKGDSMTFQINFYELVG